jgi:hypothetical protein
MPTIDVLLIVQVFTPFYQIVDFIVEVIVREFHKAAVIEGVIVQLLKSFQIRLFL